MWDWFYWFYRERETEMDSAQKLFNTMAMDPAMDEEVDKFQKESQSKADEFDNLLKAAKKFSQTQVWRDFFNTTLTKMVLSQLCAVSGIPAEEYSLILIQLLEAVMQVTIVMWEDQTPGMGRVASKEGKV